jgi:uncharacterized membrane protein
VTTGSKLNGLTILLGAVALSFVAQFLPFLDGTGGYLEHATNLQVYTELHLDLTGQGTGWDQHPNFWLFYAALVAAWFVPAVRDNDNWQVFGPWVTAAVLFYCAQDSAPLRTSGGGLAFAAFAIALWGAWRMRSERKAEEAAAAAHRAANVEQKS